MERAETKTSLAGQSRAVGAVMALAGELIAAGRFDEAEAAVRDGVAGVDGPLLLARCYRESLRTVVSVGGPRSLIEAMRTRALRAAIGAYGDPRSPMEADRLGEDVAALARVNNVPAGWRPAGAAP